MLTISSSFTSQTPPPCLSHPHLPFRTLHHRSLLLTPTAIDSSILTSKLSFFSRPISPSLPRKLRCRPASAKYVKEDYLVKKLSAKEVEELVKGERNVPLVIDFYATWCGPCILMAQELEMLAVEYENNALIVKVDTDDEYEFARDMQVRGLPTLYFISPDSNKDAIRTEGLIPIQMMRDIIDNHM
ncbi:Protein disulfide-isomerase [Bertholletia excelsa]